MSPGEAMLRSIFRSVPQAICVLGPDRTLRLVNEGTVRMFGLPRAALVGQKSRVLYATEKDYEHAGRTAYATLDESGCGMAEVSLRRADGHEFPALLSVAPLAPGDRSAGVVVVITDISERKRAEATLRASEQRLDMALEVTGACVWDVHLPTGRLALSGRLPTALGYAPDEWPRTLEELRGLVHPEDRTAARAAYEAHLRGETAVYSSEHRVRRKDGTWSWVSVHAGIVEQSEAGVPLRLVGFGVDISELKAAEAALRRSEERFRRVADFTGQLIYEWDLASDRVDWCGRVQAITGYTLAELSSHGAADWAARLHPEDRERVLALLDAARRRRRNYVCEYRFRRADGTFMPVREEGTFLRDETGRVVRMLGVLQDVSERQRAEAEQAHLQRQLHQAQKMEAIGQLAGGVAHDFNNLLTVIMGSVDLLRTELRRHGGREEGLQAIAEAAEQAKGVTRALLTFSHHLPPEKRAIDLADVVGRAMKLLKRLIPAAVECTVVAEPGTPLAVDGDATQLQQVLINLAVNARDAMPHGGALRVTLGRRDHPELGPACPYVGVQDTGVGMSPETAHHIFEPFFTTKARGQGTGLGLAIVHGIMTEHGGHIEVQSTPGAGTRFTLVFPPARGLCGNEVADERAVPRGQGELLLVAEDYEQLRRLFVSELSDLGYRVVPCADGHALLQAWAAHGPQVRLLVLDVDLPKADGLECLRVIRGHGDHTPALLLTGSVEASVAARPDQHTHLLRKPFLMRELSLLVAELLAHAAPAECAR